MKKRKKSVAGVRLSRVQVLKVAQQVFVVGTLWVIVVGGGVFLRAYALKDENFSLTTIRVQGNKRSSKMEVVEGSGLQLGKNLFALDLSAAEKRLQNVGWIRGASITRQFPNGLLIEVEEHEPVALVSLGDLFYLNKNGKAFRPYLPGEEVNLPVLIGLERAGYERGAPAVLSKIQTGLDFLVAWRIVFGSRWAMPRTIEVGAAGLVSYVDERGTEIFVGQAPWDKALGFAKDTLRGLGSRTSPPSTMYLGRGHRLGRVTVLMRGSSYSEWDAEENGRVETR